MESILEEFKKTFAVLFVVLMFLSIVVNVVCLMGLTRSYHKRRFRDYLFVSLNVCDILRVSLSTPLEVRGLLKHSSVETDEEHLCKPISFFIYMLEFTSIAHILIIVIDRYVCVCQPTIALKIYLKRNRIYQAILLTYVNGFFWAVLPLLGLGSYGFQIDEIQCGLKALHDTNTKVYISLVLVLANGLPIMSSFACLFRIKKKFNQTSANIRVSKKSTTIETDENMNGETSNNRGQKELLRYFSQDQRQFQMVLTLILVFIVTWFLYDVILFEEIFFADKPNVYLEILSNFVAHSSALVNPIIILYFCSDLRITLLKIKGLYVRRRRREIENQNIPNTRSSVAQNDGDGL